MFFELLILVCVLIALRRFILTKPAKNPARKCEIFTFLLSTNPQNL